jgi:hypothetical protein
LLVAASIFATPNIGSFYISSRPRHLSLDHIRRLTIEAMVDPVGPQAPPTLLLGVEFINEWIIRSQRQSLADDCRKDTPSRHHRRNRKDRHLSLNRRQRG